MWLHPSVSSTTYILKHISQSLMEIKISQYLLLGEHLLYAKILLSFHWHISGIFYSSQIEMEVSGMKTEKNRHRWKRSLMFFKQEMPTFFK